MDEEYGNKKVFWRIVSYILVAALASSLTFFLVDSFGQTKLMELSGILQRKYIGEMDEDAVADAMVTAVGDRWSYYMTAEEHVSYEQRKSNTYVGIGITVSARQDKTGIDITMVEPNGSAVEAGIQPGDILVEVEGQDAASLGINDVAGMIRGEEGTMVTVAVVRDGEKMTFTLPRKTMPLKVAVGQMLPEKIGLVTIANFNSNCASESKAAVEELVAQGAKALVFDVRNNPGGYVDEMVELLDYLLPKGVVFRSLEYTGIELTEYSNESCVDLPMAVLVNENSYSAAEFFAAALDEYDWAVVAGEATSGKSYFQRTYELSDGSAVNLSVGKYFTPNGVSLAEVGGLQPEIAVEVDEQTDAEIYAGILPPEDDPQIQAVIDVLLQ